MKLVNMKALAVGTVVGDILNQMGEVVSGCIVHVDPDNDSEGGRYSHPKVTEDVAGKLERAGFAERTGKTSRVEREPLTSGVSAELAAERVADVSEIDHKGPGSGVSGLDTSHGVAFADGDRVRGGAGGEGGDEDEDDDRDAPPARRAPAAAAPTPAPKPKAAKPGGLRGAAKRAAAAAPKAAAAAPTPAPTPAAAPAETGARDQGGTGGKTAGSADN